MRGRRRPTGRPPGPPMDLATAVRPHPSRVDAGGVVAVGEAGDDRTLPPPRPTPRPDPSDPTRQIRSRRSTSTHNRVKWSGCLRRTGRPGPGPPAAAAAVVEVVDDRALASRASSATMRPRSRRHQPAMRSRARRPTSHRRRRPPGAGVGEAVVAARRRPHRPRRNQPRSRRSPPSRPAPLDRGGRPPRSPSPRRRARRPRARRRRPRAPRPRPIRPRLACAGSDRVAPPFADGERRCRSFHASPTS